jgi:hypothetical protein
LKSYQGGLASIFGQASYSNIPIDLGDPLATPGIIKTASSRAVAVEMACKIYISSFITNTLHTL